MTTALVREEMFTITTSEAHVRAVARNFGTKLYVEHVRGIELELVTRREVPGLGTLVYRGEMEAELVA